MTPSSPRLRDRLESIRPGWALAILLAVTFGVFAGTLRYHFVYDDLPQIAQNGHIQSWRFFPTYFTHHLWSQDPGLRALYYRPLFLVQLRLVDALFGLWTPGWHFALLLCHLAATATVYWLVRQWKQPRTALIAAAVFALHPVHAEVVCWASAIGEPALLIALIGCLIFARREGRADQLGALALFAAALLLKETAIVWPVVLFCALYDGFGRTLRRTLAFWGMTLAYLALRLAVLGRVVGSLESKKAIDWAYLPTALAHYFLHLVWPVGLSVFRTPRPSWAYLVLVLPVLGALLWMALRDRYQRAAVLILLVPLLPVLNLASMRTEFLVQDRYLYLPSVGFAMLAALLLDRLPRPAFVLLMAAMIVGCVRESQPWRDNEHFYTRALEVSPGNQLARDGLGRAYARERRFQEAVQILQPLVQEPQPSAHRLQQTLMTLGYSLENLGRTQEAVCDYRFAVELYPVPALEKHIAELEAAGLASAADCGAGPAGAGGPSY